VDDAADSRGGGAVIDVTISVDTAKLDRLLSDFPHALAAAKRNALKAIGDEIKSEADQTFRNPVMRSSPWAPRKPTYIVTENKRTGKKKRKLDDHPLLQKSGLMKQGIDKKIVGSNTVVIGTPQEYIKYHQFGTKHMPARPVFPIDAKGQLTPRMTRKIHKLVNEALEDELRKIGLS